MQEKLLINHKEADDGSDCLKHIEDNSNIHYDNMNDYLRFPPRGTSMVCQITEYTDFQRLIRPAMAYAAGRGSEIHYIHFSDKDIYRDLPDYVRIHPVRLTHRFESFTIEVSRILAERGEGDLLVFDCLSELQTAWATDLMMENFFRVITPQIRTLGSVAVFPLIRGMHSIRANGEIRKHTWLFLDLYSDFKNLYMRPQKIGEETGGPLFMPYIYEEESGDFQPMLDGVRLSKFQRALNLSLRTRREQNLDSWDRFFERAQRDYEDGRDITEALYTMCDIMMSRDPRIRDMIRDNFRPEDYFFVKEHMVGTGLIGGKACGMLIARKIIENHCPEVYERIEPHDSFYIGSDVFYTYIVENDFWDLRVRQRTEEGYFSAAEEMHEALLKGSFSPNLEEKFIKLLEYYGQAPVIVRSSSILEDGFGNAFAGKYESVFCAGSGSLEERLAEFENAIRIVYASTMSRSALDYRIRRGLENRDEQMGLLVQRVSGSHYGDYFMPCAAGVGYSYSPYRFLESLDPGAGMLRLVMGLGTSAVDRTEGSYPRMVSLDQPAATAFKSLGEHHRFSQQNIELIDKKTGSLMQLPLLRVKDVLPPYLVKTLLSHDTQAEWRFRERGNRRDVFFISCDGLVHNRGLMEDMRLLMKAIQEEYDQPVDIEFTMNLSEDGEYIINILQCRPLQVFKDTGHTLIPEDIPEDKILLDCRHSSMGLSQTLSVDYVVIVDPVAYYKMPYHDKDRIAKLIGEINWHFRGHGKHMLLLVPGRIGTSSPELGVPTTFSDISEFAAVFEIAESRAGYSPELSYGSHIFQDLVENNILYTAVFEDERRQVFNPGLLMRLPSLLMDINPDAGDCSDIIKLYDCRGQGLNMYHDLIHERIVCAFDQA